MFVLFKKKTGSPNIHLFYILMLRLERERMAQSLEFREDSASVGENEVCSNMAFCYIFMLITHGK